jgi:hypothetical protein
MAAVTSCATLYSLTGNFILLSFYYPFFLRLREKYLLQMKSILSPDGSGTKHYLL